MPAPSAPTTFQLGARCKTFSMYASGGEFAVSDGVSLTWDALPAGVSAHVQMRQNGGAWVDAGISGSENAIAGFDVLANVYHFTSVLSASAQIFGVSTFGAAATVDFQVRAENGAGASAWVGPVTISANQVGFVSASDLSSPPAPTVTVNTSRQVQITIPADTNTKQACYQIELVNLATGVPQDYYFDTFSSVISWVPGAGVIVANANYSAKVRAVGFAGIGSLAYGPWSSLTFFTAAPPNIAMLNVPGTATFYRNAPSQQFQILTNTPATSITVTSGSLPAGLTLASGIISGVPTAAVGNTSIGLTATNGTTSDVETLTVTIAEPSISLLYALGTGTPVDSTTFNQNLGSFIMNQAVTINVTAVPSGPVSTSITLTLGAGAPGWLSVSGQSLTGTPTAPGQWSVQVQATNATQTVSDYITVTVAAVAITSANNAAATVGVAFSFTVVTQPGSAIVSLLGAPAWLSISGDAMSGVPTTAGTFSLLIVAAANGATATQLFTITVAPVIQIGDPSTGDGSSANPLVGYVGQLFLARIAYVGACQVQAWYLSGGPQGLTIGSLSCGGGSSTNYNVSGITGTPAAAGLYQATLIAQVCCSNVPSLARQQVNIAIDGGLYIHQIHSDPSLYDLQMQIRGDEVARQVQSWYGTAGSAAAQTTVTTQNTQSPGVQTTTQTTASTAATAGNLLTVKRGDHLRLALVIRDGIKLLGSADGVSNVHTTAKLPQDPDGTYVWDLSATEVMLSGGGSYWLIDTDITEESLNTLLLGDGAQSLVLAAEIELNFNGRPISSATFAVNVVDDIERA